jgi:uncharacterized OB-fold protein
MNIVCKIVRILKALLRSAWWQCNKCGHVEWYEREVICWECGKGEMIYKGK